MGKQLSVEDVQAGKYLDDVVDDHIRGALAKLVRIDGCLKLGGPRGCHAGIVFTKLDAKAISLVLWVDVGRADTLGSMLS